MREIELGPLRAKVGGGPDREGGGDGPVVVLLHGFGASGDDLVPLHRAFDLPPEVRWVFPAAPIGLTGPGFMPGMDQRAWWEIDLAALERAMRSGQLRDLSGDVPEGLAAARSKVQAFLEAVDDELSPARLVLGGFSQGAMLSLDVALHTPDRSLDGLVLLSGTMLAEAEWRPRMAARAGLPVLQSHGTADALLPFSVAERLRDTLREAGLEVEFVPFRGGHEIPGTVIGRLQAFLRGRLLDGA